MHSHQIWFTRLNEAQTHGVGGGLLLVERSGFLRAVGAGGGRFVGMLVLGPGADAVLGLAVLTRPRHGGINGVCGAGANRLRK